MYKLYILLHNPHIIRHTNLITTNSTGGINMNDLSDELDALKLTGMQRFWLMFTIVVLILA